MSDEIDISRRKAFHTFALGAGATVAGLGASIPAAQAAGASSILTVGVGGQYATIPQALRAAAGASAADPYIIMLLPGTHDLRSRQRPLTIPSWVTLMGYHRRSVEVLLNGGGSIAVTSNSAISDITFRYQGDRAALLHNATGFLNNFELSRVTIYAQGAGAAIDLTSWVDNEVMFYDLLIVTEAIGIAMQRGGFLQVYNSRIALVGENTGTFHCGYFFPQYTRMWIFGGMIGTGYGYPNVSDPGQHVVGIYCGQDMKGRVEMRSVWSICRNELAGAGDVVNCVRIAALTDDARVRAFACYLQAESPSDAAENHSVHVVSAGRFETHGNRVREFGGLQAFGGAQTGVSHYSTADNGSLLRAESGGLILLDASAGPFTLTLASGWVLEGEQYIFKKIDRTSNAVTIQAGLDWSIEGAKRRLLTAPNQTLHLRSASNTWWIT